MGRLAAIYTDVESIDTSQMISRILAIKRHDSMISAASFHEPLPS